MARHVSAASRHGYPESYSYINLGFPETPCKAILEAESESDSVSNHRERAISPARDAAVEEHAFVGTSMHLDLYHPFLHEEIVVEHELASASPIAYAVSVGAISCRPPPDTTVFIFQGSSAIAFICSGIEESIVRACGSECRHPGKRVRNRWPKWGSRPRLKVLHDDNI